MINRFLKHKKLFIKTQKPHEPKYIYPIKKIVWNSVSWATAPSIQPNSPLCNTLERKRRRQREREKDGEEEIVVAVEIVRLLPNAPIKRSFSDHQPPGNSIYMLCSVLIRCSLERESLRGPSYMNHFLKWVLFVFFVSVVFRNYWFGSWLGIRVVW